MSEKVKRALQHTPWAVALLFLVALLPRLYNLDYHSLWFDEAMSTFWAGRPAAELWRVGLSLTQDKHPPLYYLLLRGWTLFFGQGDVAVRSLGAILGALAVLPAYALGKLLGGRRAGMISALLLALNPFLIWYSQEARMFMPATTFVMVGLYGLLRTVYLPAAVASGAPRGQHGTVAARDVGIRAGAAPLAWAPLALTLAGFTAALYTYLYSAFLLPVAGLWLLAATWWRRQEPDVARRFWAGVGALGVVSVLFLPLAWSAWRVSGAEAVPGQAFAGLLPTVWKLLRVYVLGWVHWPSALKSALVVLAGLLALTGWLWTPGRPDDRAPARHGGIFLALWPLTILLVGGYLLSRDSRVFAETRYQITLVPALCLAWGRALALLWRWRRWIGLAGLAVALGVALTTLPALWAPENRREAWRETAAYIQAHAGPDDAILVHADYVHVAFDRYFDGPQPVFYPFTDVLSDPAAVDQQLQGLVRAGPAAKPGQSFAAVWLVQSHTQGLDPQNLIAGWFGARYPLISEQYPPGIAIRGSATRYRTPALPAEVPQQEPISFGDLQLLACIHDPGPVAARDDLFHPPSGWVHVTTYWTALAPLKEDLHPIVRLVDDQAQIWGDKLERSNDATHIWPTSRWQPGEVVRVDADVNLNPITPPGRYRLVVALPAGASEAACGEVVVQ